MINFLINIYKDVVLAERLLRQIRAHYPRNVIFCISDGFSESHRIKQLQTEFNFISIEGRRIKLFKYGGLWLDRQFRVLLNNSTSDYVIKLDPDAILQGKISEFPNADISGSLIVRANKLVVDGGCRIYSKEAIQKIMDSKLLKDAKYSSDSIYGYRRFSKPYLNEHELEEDAYISSEDQIMGDLIQRLGLSVKQHPEILCGYKIGDNLQGKSVVHPIKL